MKKILLIVAIFSASLTIAMSNKGNGNNKGHQHRPKNIVFPEATAPHSKTENDYLHAVIKPLKIQAYELLLKGCEELDEQQEAEQSNPQYLYGPNMSSLEIASKSGKNRCKFERAQDDSTRKQLNELQYNEARQYRAPFLKEKHKAELFKQQIIEKQLRQKREAQLRKQRSLEFFAEQWKECPEIYEEQMPLDALWWDEQEELQEQRKIQLHKESEDELQQMYADKKKNRKKLK